MKVQKTATATDQGAGEIVATTEQPADAADPVAPAAAVEPPVALEQPSAGGSYVRQADGTLVKQEG
jgi:hypothetical protein